jgi:hypothetical protein
MKNIKKFLLVSFLAIFLSIGAFNIAKAQTVPTAVTVTASSAAMVYGSAVPTITAIYSPSITTPLAVPTCSTVVTSTSPVGSYASTCSGASDPNYTFSSYTNGSVSVTQATPTITWANPADIISGTALSATQLNATASVSGTSVPGTFVYTPAIETILSAGTNQTLSVAFTPTDTADYTTATSSVAINVTAPQSSSGGSSTPSPLNVQAQVDVPASCSATDTDGVVHNYPQAGSPNSYLAICALETAIKNGSISNVQLSNFSYGLFVISINGIVANPNTSSQYWALYQNGQYANLGIAELPVAAGDSIKFQHEDFSGNNLGDQVTLNINSLISNTPISISGGGESGGGYAHPTPKPAFDINKALSFLASQQKSDGSFGPDLYTDWTALSLASNPNYQDQKTKLAAYFSGNKLSGNLLTDNERRAMALMSLNLNPYNTNGENYINSIVTSFDGKQFGDVNQDNDDIFALIVLQNAGYTQNDQMITSDISFILSKQNSDGSWDGSPDMTGATMESLSAFNQNAQVKTALLNAENYLKQNQKDDGSWNENASSTAWAIEGILAQGEKPENWTKNPIGNTPLDYLATLQDTDGGIKDSNIQNKIWETDYAVSALSGKTWNQEMQKFDKPANPAPVVIPKTTVQKPIAKKIVAIKNINTGEIKPVNSVNQNTASAINAITPSPAATKINTQIETPKKNWFERLINSIFGTH